MGNKSRRADSALWAGVDALTLILLVGLPLLALVGGVIWLILTG